jgi:hypothetical protein
VPLKDVGYLTGLKSPQYLYLHLTSFPIQHNLQKFITALSNQTSSAQILISGSAVQTYKKLLPDNVRLFESFQQVVSYISALA